MPKTHKLRLRLRDLPPFWLGILVGFVAVAVAFALVWGGSLFATIRKGSLFPVAQFVAHDILKVGLPIPHRGDMA
jgi:hypothetical protein